MSPATQNCLNAMPISSPHVFDRSSSSRKIFSEMLSSARTSRNNSAANTPAESRRASAASSVESNSSNNKKSKKDKKEKREKVKLPTLHMPAMRFVN